MSVIADILLLPWSLLTKGVLRLGSYTHGVGSVVLPVVLVVGVVVIANKVIGMRAARVSGASAA
jgi:hypothetical protein